MMQNVNYITVNYVTVKILKMGKEIMKIQFLLINLHEILRKYVFLIIHCTSQ